MSEAFQLALDRLFARLGVKAIYNGQYHHNVAIEVILKAPDVVMNFQQTHLHSQTQVIDVKCSDINQPVVGDTIIVNNTHYRIQSEPVCDVQHLFWKMDVVRCVARG